MDASSRVQEPSNYYSHPGEDQPGLQASQPLPKRPSSQPRIGKKQLNRMRKYSRENSYFRIFIIGIFLIMAGYIVSSSTGYMDPPDREDYDDNDDKYQAAMDFYYDLKDGLVTTGKIFENVGMIIIILALFMGAIMDEKVPVYVRVGMVISMGLIVAFGI